MRIFADKKDAKRYISEFYDESTTDNATLEQKERKDGSDFPFLDDDMYDVFVEEKEERGFEI